MKCMWKKLKEITNYVFTTLLPAVIEFLIKAVLPEVIAYWFTRLAKIELSASNMSEDSNTCSNKGADGNDSTNNSVIEKHCVCNGTDDGRHDIV